MSRKACTAKQALEVAIQQGAIIPCFRCRTAFTLEDAKTKGAIEREHVHALARGGEDQTDNWAWSHKACHARQTNGPSHYSDGDKYAIAKANRLARGGKTKRGPKLQSRNDWPQGRKLQSRPFERRNAE